MRNAQEEAKRHFYPEGTIRRTGELVAEGVHPRDLYALRDAGILDEVTRGAFRLSGSPPLEDPDLVVVGLRVPKAVVCLVSALHFHGMTDQVPRAVHIALPRGMSAPQLNWPPIRTYRFSPPSYEAGAEPHVRDGVQIRVYSPAKTVADCFKFRNKVGIETALESLRVGLREKRFTPADLMEYARTCRVRAIIRPYAEAML